MTSNHLQTDEDVEQILKLAVRHSGDGSLTLRERLQASAHELGISAEALAKAEHQYRVRKERDREFEIYKRKARAGFVSHLVPFVLVNTMLMIMSIGDHESWWIYPLFGWGIGLIMHGIGALNTKSEAFRRDFEIWLARRRGVREQEGLVDVLDNF